MASVRVNCWPHPGAIGLVERLNDADAPLTQVHVIRNWCDLGTVERIEDAHALTSVTAGFDADGYEILCKPILSCEVEIVPLTKANLDQRAA